MRGTNRKNVEAQGDTNEKKKSIWNGPLDQTKTHCPNLLF